MIYVFMAWFFTDIYVFNFVISRAYLYMKWYKIGKFIYSNKLMLQGVMNSFLFCFEIIKREWGKKSLKEKFWSYC